MNTRMIVLSLAALLGFFFESCKHDDPAPDPSAYVTIPDVNFEKALVALKIDDVQDGKLLTANAQKVTSLEVSSKQIASLQGIETFTNLAYLDIRSNALTAVDLTKATSLSALLGSDNKLPSLDVSKNVALKYLDCSSNMLTALDVSKNTALNYLTCSVNKIISLDVSQNTALTDFDCQSNLLTTLDVSKNVKLGTLFCSTNKLTSLDVSKNTALFYLDCSSNQLTALDLKANTLLQGMISTKNNIQSICVVDVSKIPSAWRKDATATYQVCK